MQYIKREIKNSSSRVLKKRRFKRILLGLLKSSLKSIFISYPSFTYFIKKNKITLSKKLVTEIVLSEIGTINILFYWSKFYSKRNY